MTVRAHNLCAWAKSYLACGTNETYGKTKFLSSFFQRVYQPKIEMSYSYQNRNVRFLSWGHWHSFCAGTFGSAADHAWRRSVEVEQNGDETSIVESVVSRGDLPPA